MFKLIIATNIHIRDAACLHVVHILKYPTSSPTSKSTHSTIVTGLNENPFPHPVGNTASWHTEQHDDFIMWMKERVAWTKKSSTPLEEHGTAFDETIGLQGRSDEKHTVYAMTSKRNKSTILSIEIPPCQESELERWWLRLSNSRMIWEMLKGWDRQPESAEMQLRICYLLS